MYRRDHYGQSVWNELLRAVVLGRGSDV
jgi:hypothetical protein